MVGDILKIKTSIPPSGVNIVERPRILERMEDGLTVGEGFTRPLTLISAPAGSGKTTLARSWLAGCEEQAAWFSLDEGDNEPERFWIYLVSALQSRGGGPGKGTLEILRAGALPLEAAAGTEAFLTPLLNDLFALEDPLFLVLDDYHLVDDSRIHKGMIFFIENLPPAVHLAVTTRSDPPWPLSRWRARGKMIDIRSDELRFNEEEAGRLFASYKELQLSEGQLGALYHKIEGWVTGLQLAAISLSRAPDRDELIENFTGSHRHVLHFLTEEVFAGQPEAVRVFLLETSILNRFCAPLCRAITGRDDSAAILANLERDNLFIISLDEQGTWYRYHRLFSDLLRHHFDQSFPGKAAALHEKAGSWFLEAGEPGEAARHALAGENLVQAALIVHDHTETILQTEGPGQLVRCLQRFSPAVLKQYPRLAVYKALFLLILKGIEEAGACLELAGELGYEDKREQDEFAGLLAAVKAYYNVNTFNIPQAMANAEEALKLLPEDNTFWRMGIAIFSGDARFFSGNPKEAHSYYREAYRSSEYLRNNLYTFSIGFKVATSLYYLGRLDEAEELTRDLLQTAKKEGLAGVPQTGLLWTLLAELLREKGELPEAKHCMERGIFLSGPEKNYPLAWNYLLKTALSFSQRDYHRALETIRQIEAVNINIKLPFHITFAAAGWKARINLALEDFQEAREILSATGITEESGVQGGREAESLVLARILLAENRSERARKLLDRIEELAAAGENKKVLMETLLVKTRVEDKTGNPDATERCLASALRLGHRSGYYQVFLDEGGDTSPVMARVMEGMERDDSPGAKGELLDYVREIHRAVAPVQDPARHNKKSRARDFKDATSPYRGLVEELSSRELEILELIGRGHSNRDISQQLFLSLGTVKWHTSNIYGKMGVRGRTQAVAEARKLKIIR